MSRLIPTPMPVVLSVAEAAERFGAGSQGHLMAKIAIEGHPVYPPPTAEQIAEAERSRFRYACLDALREIGACMAYVEAHAVALFEADGSGSFSLNEWRDLARVAVGRLYERSPALLPFTYEAHEYCGRGFE
jgi:hypothetical protein